jgi:hypothetical protein
MVRILREEKVGKAEIKHYKVTAEESRYEAMMGAMRGERYGGTKPGSYAMLFVDKTLWMSDTDMEWITNREFVNNAHGNVLIAGLGMGFILRAIMAKPEVKSIVVVESNLDVAELVLPRVAKWPGNKKLLVEIMDIHKYIPASGQRFHTAYFDIWPSVNPDNWPEMKKLKAKARGWMMAGDPFNWIGCWREMECRRFDASCRRQERTYDAALGGKVNRMINGVAL